MDRRLAWSLATENWELRHETDESCKKLAHGNSKNTYIERRYEEDIRMGDGLLIIKTY